MIELFCIFPLARRRALCELLLEPQSKGVSTGDGRKNHVNTVTMRVQRQSLSRCACSDSISDNNFDFVFVCAFEKKRAFCSQIRPHGGHLGSIGRTLQDSEFQSTWRTDRGTSCGNPSSLPCLETFRSTSPFSSS